MRRPDLISDCGRCDAICCIATSFDASDDFAISKPAGSHCPHLTPLRRCAIHDKRIERGFLGCTLYECYGAGPEITQRFAGASEPQRDAAFTALRTVHELLWLLTEAAKLCPASRPDVADELAREAVLLDAIAHGPTSALLALDLTLHEERARVVLRRVGDAVGRRGRTRRLPVLPGD